MSQENLPIDEEKLEPITEVNSEPEIIATSDDVVVQAEDAPAESEVPVSEVATEVTSTQTEATLSAESGEAQAVKSDQPKKKRRRKKSQIDQESIMNLQKGQYMTGKVKNITEFGAFVDLGLAQDGLIHISQLARHKVENASDVVSEGQDVEVWVKKVDKKRGRISLTMIKPVKLRLKDIKDADELEGVVTRLESYGAFIDVESEREGLVHISEITHEYINHPQEVLKVGDPVKIKVLKVDQKKRQIDLSIKALLPPPPPKEIANKFVPPQENRQPRRPAPQKQEAPVQINDDEPMVTAMAAAFSLFQDLPDENGDSKKGVKSKNKRGDELEAIITRTLVSAS